MIGVAPPAARRARRPPFTVPQSAALLRLAGADPIAWERRLECGPDLAVSVLLMAVVMHATPDLILGTERAPMAVAMAALWLSARAAGLMENLPNAVDGVASALLNAIVAPSTAAQRAVTVAAATAGRVRLDQAAKAIARTLPGRWVDWIASASHTHGADVITADGRSVFRQSQHARLRAALPATVISACAEQSALAFSAQAGIDLTMILETDEGFSGGNPNAGGGAVATVSLPIPEGRTLRPLRSPVLPARERVKRDVVPYQYAQTVSSISVPSRNTLIKPPLRP